MIFTSIRFLKKDSLTPLTSEDLMNLETEPGNSIQQENNRHHPPAYAENCLDLIISNPPYKSWGLGRSGKLPSDMETTYRTHFSHSAEYKISLYSLFIERAIQLLRPNGIGAVLIPDSFLMGKYFRKLRHFLLQSTKLREIALFQKNFWAKADSGKPVILLFQKIKNPSRSDSAPMITRMLGFSDTQLSLVKYHSLNPSSFLALHETRFRLFFSTEDEKFVQECEKDSVSMKTFYEIHHGIRSKSGIGKAAITGKIQKTDNWRPGLISGKSVQPFSIKYEEDFILIKPELLYSGGFNPVHIAQEKIILQRTGDRLTGAVDSAGFYHTNTLLYLIPLSISENHSRPGPSLHAMCAVLNSDLFNRYYQIISLKAHRTLPQVEIDMVNELPLKNSRIHDITYQKLDQLSRKLHKHYQLHQSQKSEEKNAVNVILTQIECLVKKVYSPDFPDSPANGKEI